MENTEIEQIPSLFETNSVDLKFVAKDFVNGLKILDDNKFYIVGNLALSEGVSPHKNINGEPEELDYRLLMKAALLLAVQKKGNPLTVTSGFPFSTYLLYKDKAKELLSKQHTIEFDTSTFSGGGKKKLVVEVENSYIMPEAVGCALGLRSQGKASGNFFIISLGYGTCEAILSTENGLVQRSSLSTFGLRFAVKLLEAELTKNYYLDLKNEHQIDSAFRQGFIFLNRKRVDITELRKNVLKQYYNDVLSPGLRKAFDDNDFSKANSMYLAGGGALYNDLVEEFKTEFEGISEVKVPENAPFLAAIGYCYNSLKANGGDAGRAVGIDVGNSTTVLCTFYNENV
jgi:plasmid segregation protein ParM